MQQRSPWWWVGSAAVVMVAAGALLYWWQQRQASAPAVVAQAPVETPEPAPAPSAPPGIQHPLEAASAPAEMPDDPHKAEAYVKDALIDLLGRAQVLTLLNTDNFLFRTVATVDSLSRAQSASRMWPVVPMPGRFTPEPVNARRYAKFVEFVESIDTARAVALYKRLYPLLQRAFDELGYPGQYFNDRVVQTIDHLIETPEPATPPALKLVQVNSPLGQSARPWTRYEYVDPALEQRSAGQKILLRVGLDNERRLKSKLSQFREGIATPAPGATPATAR